VYLHTSLHHSFTSIYKIRFLLRENLNLMQKSISAGTFTEPSTYTERLMASLKRLHSVLRWYPIQSIIKQVISKQFILLVVLVLLICYCPCCTIAWHHTLVEQLEQTGSLCDKRARGRKRSVALSKKLSMQQWRQKQKHGGEKSLTFITTVKCLNAK
jgi:hypothetical protein